MDPEAGLLSTVHWKFGKSKLKLEPKESDVVEKSPTGRYVRYNEILGRGASKIVYKGFDEVEGIEVAWNQISVEHALESPENLERLYSEVHLLKMLKHENIMKFYGSWVDDESKTIVMITELFTSGSLRQFRKKHKNVDMKAIKNWARQILQGLYYLHSHSPPIIHRDLKCDNIFVNGNHGEVKIGDLGLATIMQRPSAHSVIGTPEFMAPELYDEDYNELVDIYSFGLCVLELVTCEYPYSECNNHAQIYKKVTSGIKPAALGRVNDPEVRKFIEKCLVPSHLRMSAAELLKEPFFSIENWKEPLQLHSYLPKSIDVPNPDSLTMEIDSDHSKLSVSTAKSATETNCALALALRGSNGKHEYKLEGQMNDDDSISITLRIANLYGQGKNVHFIFFLKDDTALSIASEMADQLELSTEDLTCIAKLIDNLIVKLVPGWKSSFGNLNNIQSSCENSIVGTDQSSVRCSWASRISMGAVVEQPGSISRANEEASRIEWGDISNECAVERCEGILSESITMNDIMKNSEIPVACGALSNDFGSLSISNQSGVEGDQPEELKQELYVIHKQYQHFIQQLTRMKAEAIENAKKKWITKKMTII